jgi:hypothetical protein
MRDKLKDKNYFETFIEDQYRGLSDRIIKLKNGLIANERIIPVKEDMTYSYLRIIAAKYSLGVATFEEMKIDLCKGIQLLNECMVDNNGKFYYSKKKEYWDQYYVNTHQEILQYISLAYLLEIPESDCKVLINIIDRDNTSDDLLEFIIKTRFSNREQKGLSQNGNEFTNLKVYYDKLDKATKLADKVESSKLVKQFLEKDYYHKYLNFYNSHKNEWHSYSGYWSFEAAALVKIMDLDDSSFINNQYFPKDLVHFNNK